MWWKYYTDIRPNDLLWVSNLQKRMCKPQIRCASESGKLPTVDEMIRNTGVMFHGFLAWLPDCLKYWVHFYEHWQLDLPPNRSRRDRQNRGCFVSSTFSKPSVRQGFPKQLSERRMGKTTRYHFFGAQQRSTSESLAGTNAEPVWECCAAPYGLLNGEKPVVSLLKRTWFH